MKYPIISHNNKSNGTGKKCAKVNGAKVLLLKTHTQNSISTKAQKA